MKELHEVEQNIFDCEDFTFWVIFMCINERNPVKGKKKYRADLFIILQEMAESDVD